MSGRRLAHGGAIDRSRPLGFSFDGRRYGGFAGDTLASALLANGVDVVGRSFKLHRPRGLYAAGVEEPNALMQVGTGAHSTPNLRASEVELYDALQARSVNAWPSARFDLAAMNDRFARFLPAGFYYKTWMWPRWGTYEGAVRAAAGLGRAPRLPDPDRHETRHATCDVLVVGAGPAGLAAALAAARRGSRVLLAEQDPVIGGSLLWDEASIDGEAAAAWTSRVGGEIAAAAAAELLVRTTAIGYYDHNHLVLLQRGLEGGSADRLWQVRADQVVLACGALERPLVFPGNDRPGVMLASAVRTYLARFAVLAGERAVILTNNDTAYACAHALLDAGGQVAALLDTRPDPPPGPLEALRRRGVLALGGASVGRTFASPALRRVEIIDADGGRRVLDADLLAVSGGWNPNVQLFSQSGGELGWDAERALFRPARSVQAETSVGAAAGTSGLDAALQDGWWAGGGEGPAPHAPDAERPWTLQPAWGSEHACNAGAKAFVDLQNDVTVQDVALARREAFVSVEHLKRYTTLGMGTDQGRTANVNGLALMAALTGRRVAEIGTTRFRPPCTPTPIGAFAGRTRGALVRPLRRLPTHERQVEAGAELEEFGGWLRPACYPRPGEDPSGAIAREARAVREAVGLLESSPLGKLEVVGPDAGVLLDRVSAVALSTLKVGRLRYGLFLNEQGVVIDDGVSARLAPERFLLGTTGAGAERMAGWLEEWLQCEWPDLRVLVAPVTTAWAVLTLSGPRARETLAAAGTDIDLTSRAFPHMSWREGRVATLAARVMRVSFTGEVSFEIAVGADRAVELWDAVTSAGAAFGLAPVGIEAWDLLRIEKGYLHVGAETDGSTSARDIGFDHVLGRGDDFIGRRSLTRLNDLRPDRLQLVGLETEDGRTPLPVGAHLRSDIAPDGESVGYVTSSGWGPGLGRAVALGWVRGGRGRLGEALTVASGPAAGRRVRIARPGGYDPQGERLRD